jgi:hypothetical protein
VEQLRELVSEIKDAVDDKNVREQNLPEEVKKLKLRLVKAEAKKTQQSHEPDNEPTIRNSDDRFQEEIKALNLNLKQIEKEKKDLQKQLLNEINFNKQLQIKSKATNDMQTEGKNHTGSLRSELDHLNVELESNKAKLQSALASLDISERRYREAENAIKDLFEDSNIDKLIQDELQDEKLTQPLLKLSILPNAISKFIRQQRKTQPDLVQKSTIESNKSKPEGASYREQLRETEARYEALLAQMKRLNIEHEEEVRILHARVDQLEQEEMEDLRAQLDDAVATANALRDANTILEDARHDDVNKSRDLRRREEHLKEAENRLFKLREKLQDKDRNLKEREEQLSMVPPKKTDSVSAPDDRPQYIAREGIEYSHFLDRLKDRDLVEELINTLPRDSQLASYLQQREGDPREPKAVCDELR